MLASDFRKMAREKLAGKWATAVCMTLAYGVVFFVIGFVQGLLPQEGLIALLASIGVYAIEIPLVFGLVFAFFKLFYGKDVHAFSFWSLGFDNFGRSWGIAFRTILKLLVPLILMIVSIVLIISNGIMSYNASFSLSSSSSDILITGLLTIISFILFVISSIWLTVKSYHYLLAQYVAFDNPNLTPKECVEKSKELMSNRRGKLFGLQFSFIGWMILSCFTFYIGFLWLLPYMQMATIAFYHVVANKENSKNSEI